jgi:hypothetical protein
MEENERIRRVVKRAKCLIRESGACFGYVFELDESRQTFIRGAPLTGTIKDEETIQPYFEPLGKRALELLKSDVCQAVPIRRQGADDQGDYDWFAVILTSDVDANACIAVVFPFVNEAAAVQILRLVQMVMTPRELV